MDPAGTKDSDAHVRFTFLTGISKFSNMGRRATPRSLAVDRGRRTAR